jgi:glycosyltransferase involved in cell wall biosynthesis
MKIVHVHHHYWPVVGGLENVVKALAEGMANLGHEVHVVTSPYGAEGRPREEEVNGVRVHRVKSARLHYPDLTYPLSYPLEALKGADIVHGHSQNSLFTVKVIEKAKKLGAKTVIHFMAVDALSDHPNSFFRLLGPSYAGFMLRKALSSADVVLVRSLRDLDLLSKRYSVHAEYVPDGVPTWFVEREYYGDVFKKKYNIDRDYVLYIGRLHPLKGIDTLIRAMSLVKTDINLVIAGPGDKRPYAELAERLGIYRKVNFLGFIDEDTKIGAIDASLAVIIPSISDYVEVYPMAITEAWARGKPVIATMVGGIPYRVNHMVNGLLVPPRNPKALAEAIMLLYNDKDLRTKLGNEGRKNIYTWSEIVNKLIQIYTTS